MSGLLRGAGLLDFKKNVPDKDINRTDAIHRALDLYTFLLRERVAGQDLLLRDPAGEITKLAWP